MFILNLSVCIVIVLLLFSGILLLKKSPLQRIYRYLAVAGLLVVVHHLTSIHQLSCHSHCNCTLMAGYFPLHLFSAMPVAPALYCFLLAFLGHSNCCCRHIVCTLAAMLPVAGYLIWFLLLSPIEKSSLYSGQAMSVVRWIIGLHLYFYIQSGIYYLLCFLLLYRQRRFGYLWEINRSRYNIRWVQVFVSFCIGGFVAYILYSIVSHFDRSCREFGLWVIDMQVVGLLVYLFLNGKVTMREAVDKPETALSTGSLQVEPALQQLQQMLDSTSLYLSPDCTLQTVAERCNLSQHHLSYLLNTHLQTNFTDYINRYRIAYACRLLNDEATCKRMTFDAISCACGFGSRASFYRAFKKHTDTTPCEYRRR